MNIGFDLDNVFIGTPPLIPQSLIERLYRKKTNGVLIYRIPSQAERIIRIISHQSLFRPPVKKNLKFLKFIAQKEHKLFLISSRFDFLKKQTEKIVNKHNLNKLFHLTYFNELNKQPHIFKHELIKSLSIDRYVDDDLYLLKYIASRNNKVKLYWLNKYINKQISKNIQAITHLSDILIK